MSDDWLEIADARLSANDATLPREKVLPHPGLGCQRVATLRGGI